MTRRKFQEFPTSTPPSYPDQKTKDLFRAILKLRDENEAVRFFRDLLTLPEIEEFSQRFEIVKLLAKGLSYANVAEKTKTSTTTVTRVAHWLYNGAGGYKLILDRLGHESLKKKLSSKPFLSGKRVFPR